MTATQTSPTPSKSVSSQRLEQAVTGLVPPQLGEAVIRSAWPRLSGSRIPGVAWLAQALIRSIILAPLGWLILLPLFLKKITPFVGKRYVLTNRRLMMVRFGRKKPYREVALADVEDVLIPAGSHNSFYRTATLEIVSGGRVAMRLRGVPEPEGFKRAILGACKAWVPGRTKLPPPELLASAKTK
jgi:hypothetical protein